MMVKVVEVKDVGTEMQVAAIKMQPTNRAQREILRKNGFGGDVGLLRLDNKTFSFDPNSWGDSTTQKAHVLIAKDFDDLIDGDVITV